MEKNTVAIIGAGLAGCECALTLAQGNIDVTLFEQKPTTMSPAHQSPLLAELVCSNSLRSNELSSGIGLLKEEMRTLHSTFMRCADAHTVPAGKALAVDREAFSQAMTQAVKNEPHIHLVSQAISSLDAPELAQFSHIIIAAGPLATAPLANSLADLIGQTHLYFYDAIAPIIAAESIDMSIVFQGSRYGHEQENPDPGDYLNCPMNKEEYLTFYNALMTAEKVPARAFEKEIHFEGCMPIEALAERGERTLTFGSLKPVGFIDPRTGHRPWALLQLRQENHNATMYNLVGCQTKLTYSAQQEVFRLVPGLHNATFIRFGSMHRNTYINAPQTLNADLSLKKQPRIYLAGQITGVEGYVESAACGLWLGLLLRARFHGKELPLPPEESALGAMLAHLQRPVKKFQPSNAHFGLMPELGEAAKKKDRKALFSQRAQRSFAAWQKTYLP